MPKVSVITIFLNAGSFIDQTFASVARQNLTDCEMILVDDGSSDSSSAIARAAADAGKGRIPYFDHEHYANLGLAASRNRGLSEASGDLILNCDADDLLFPEALTTLAGALDRRREIDLVSGATLFWNWDPAFAEESDRMRSFRHWAGRTIDGAKFLAAMIIDETLHPANCSTMIRR
ncbi:glycosyltransferase family 2 protein [Sphingomonas koreensis]|nr:glycosyltransferase family 2 protein [Sphingomonas koreensis]